MKPKPSRLRWLLVVCALAFVARAVAAMAIPAAPEVDAADYHMLAQSLAADRGYVDDAGKPFGFQPPGYPVFVAAVYRVAGGAHPKAVYLAQAVLGAGSVALIALLAAHFFGPSLGLAAGAVAAFYPMLIYASRALMSENLYVFILLATLWAAVPLVEKRGGAGRAAAVGALLGLGTLVRSANIFVALVFGWWFLGQSMLGFRKKGALALVPVALVAACCAGTILPWTARNYVTFGHFVPVGTSDGLTLYASYWPPLGPTGKRLWGKVTMPEDPVYAEAMKLENPAERSRFFRRKTLDGLRADPFRIVKYLPEKLVFLFLPIDYEIWPHTPEAPRHVNWGYLLAFLPMVLGAAALWRVRDSRLAVWLLGVVPAATVAQALIFYGSPRFRAPLEAVFLVLVPAGALELSRLLQGKTRKSTRRSG